MTKAATGKYGSCVTLCSFSRQTEVIVGSDEVPLWAKRLSYGSDEVLSSLSYLYCRLNGKRVSDQRSKYWRNSMIILWILNVLIIHEYLILTAAYLVFWTTVPVSRGFYRMKKLREFVHNKCKTLFRVASPFWTNIEYSHRVPTSIFSVEIVVGELIDPSQSTNFFKVSKHWDFLVCPGTTISPTTKYWDHFTFLNKITVQF